MGFQPQDAGTFEHIFGLLKLNLTYGPVFARAYTVKRCLILISVWIVFLLTLKDTARYAGLLLAPAEGFGHRPMAFFALRAKKESLLCCFGPFLAFFGAQ